MKIALNKSQALALALLLGVIAIMLFVVILPITQSLVSKFDTVRQHELSLEKFRRIAGQSVQVEMEFDGFKSSAKARHEFFTEASPALAGATMQTKLRRLASRNKVSFSSIKTLPPKEEPVKTLIEVKVNAQGTTEEILSFIEDVERSNPYLFVDELNIRPSRLQTTSNSVQLDLEFSVKAYVLSLEES